MIENTTKNTTEEVNENLTDNTSAKNEAQDALEAAARRKLDLICEACDETKAQNFLALDVRRQTPIADYFAICSGTSATHISSIAQNVQDKLRDEGKVRAKPQGGAESFWIILDYGDVILHIFDDATRDFYDLERLWSDAVPVECSGDGSTPASTSESAELQTEGQTRKI